MELVDPLHHDLDVAQVAETLEKTLPCFLHPLPVGIGVDGHQAVRHGTATAQGHAQVMHRIGAEAGSHVVALFEHPLHPVAQTARLLDAFYRARRQSMFSGSNDCRLSFSPATSLRRFHLFKSTSFFSPTRRQGSSGWSGRQSDLSPPQRAKTAEGRCSPGHEAITSVMCGGLTFCLNLEVQSCRFKEFFISVTSTSQETRAASARAFVHSLNILIKYARMYGFDHKRTEAQFEIAWNELQQGLPKAGDSGFLLGVTDNKLLLDGIPLETGNSERSFAQLLSAAGLASLNFSKEVTVDDFTRLVRAFTLAGSKAQDVTKQIKEALGGNKPGSTIRINEVKFVAADPLT